METRPGLENDTRKTPQADDRESIAPFIHRKIVVLHQNQTAYQAARAMCENNIGCVVVVDGKGHMTGILTDRDIACGLATLNQSIDTPISEFMSKGLVKVDERAKVPDVIELMKKNGIRRIPVVKRLQKVEKCVGLVTLDDLLASNRISPEDVATITKSQIRRRERRRAFNRPAETSGKVDEVSDFARLLDKVVEKTGLNLPAAETLMDSVLTLIVRRLNYTVAGRLIELLPKRLQTRLLDLPAGPDLFITPDLIREAVTSNFDVSPDDSAKLIANLWQAISETVDPFQLDMVTEQFPDEIQILLAPLSAGVNAPRKKQSPQETSPRSDLQ